MTNENNSAEQWQQDLVERQQNLTPADITRSSQFRRSGLPRNAPLPIAVTWKRVWVGAVLFLLGVGVRLVFDIPYSLVACAALSATGLFTMLSAIRWTAR